MEIYKTVPTVILDFKVSVKVKQNQHFQFRSERLETRRRIEKYTFRHKIRHPRPLPLRKPVRKMNCPGSPPSASKTSQHPVRCRLGESSRRTRWKTTGIKSIYSVLFPPSSFP